MVAVDSVLLNEALVGLVCTDLGPIGARGGQKAVHLVERASGRCVLKVVAVDFASSEAFKRAEREVELLESIDCENVVKVESSLVELGQPVHGAAWIEEYMDGEDLGSLLFTRQWSWMETRDMGIQVARGVAAAQSKKVIHRDLSANNVRRLSSGTYKVLDFGFARHTLRSGVTIAGQPGTYDYLTPEHLNSYSGGPTSASDVFQIGALMYAALAGRVPFKYEGDDAEYFGRLFRGEYDRIQTIRSDIPPAAFTIIQRALHPQPARRFLDAEALESALGASC